MSFRNAARISQHETIIFGGNGNGEGADAWSHPKSWLQEKNERSNERMLSFFPPMVLLTPTLTLPPPSSYSRWSSFSIAAIFVYGTSRRRKRGRSDDAEEASARGGCGRESEDVRSWGGQGRLENRWRGSADSSPARIANGWFCEERKGEEKEGGRRREARRKETRNGQKDNIESRGSERGGEIPEKSPGIDGQDDADQSPGFVSRSPGPQTDPRFSFSSPKLFHNISSKRKSLCMKSKIYRAPIYGCMRCSKALV